MQAEAARDGRVLLALERAARSSGSMDVALRLAAAMGAELTGVFVEDVDLLRVAALPFTQEVGLVSGALRPLESGGLEATLRRQAEQVRRLLADRAQGSRVKWSFRVARGKLPGEVLAGARRADVVVAAERGRAAKRQGGGRSGSEPQTVTAVFEPTEAGQRVLSMALSLTQGHVQRLSVLVPDAGRLDMQALRESAARAMQVAPNVPRIESLPSRQAAGVLRAAWQCDSVALVLSISSLSDADTQIRLLLEESSCPLVLVL